MKKAVTFDAVGTLFVPHPSVGEIYAEVAREGGMDFSADELNERFPAAFKQARQSWKVPYGADEEDARRFWHAVIDATFGEPLPFEIGCELYDTFAHAKRWRVCPGVAEALAWLAHARIPTAVISNYDRRLLTLLAECDLWFQAVLTSTMVGRAKPDSAILFEACRRLDVTPAEVLHVGDREDEDGLMCEQAGATWMRVACESGIGLAELQEMLRQP